MDYYFCFLTPSYETNQVILMLHQQEIYADMADIGEAGEAEDIEANDLQTQAPFLDLWTDDV